MEGLTLLVEARRAGLKVQRAGDQLVIEGPEAQEQLALELLARKADILLVLELERAFGPLDTCKLTEVVPISHSASLPRCFACGGSRRWRLRALGDRGDWLCGRCQVPLRGDDEIEWSSEVPA